VNLVCLPSRAPVLTERSTRRRNLSTIRPEP
jgi:hypothetical protein